jgi:hypothetical protein
VVTCPQIFEALNGLVGEHSIKRALKALAPNGEPLLVEIPSPRPPSPADADTEVEFLQDNKCFVERQKPPESQTEAEMTAEVRGRIALQVLSTTDGRRVVRETRCRNVGERSNSA